MELMAGEWLQAEDGRGWDRLRVTDGQLEVEMSDYALGAWFPLTQKFANRLIRQLQGQAENAHEPQH